MHKFDYSFLINEIPGNILRLTDIIADLRSKEEFRKLQYKDSFEKLKEKAIIESVRDSNAIEGIVTTDSRIKDLIAGSLPSNHDEQEIIGYKDVLNLIHNEHDNLQINEETICMFHKMIEEYTNNEAGTYKKNNNYIMEYSEDGTRRIRFKPIEAKDTNKAMEQLILAFYEARQNSNISPLLLIPCFIVDFLCIHPFNDGNGRVSRLLTILLLYNFGYDIVKYISLEGQINKYKDNYYEALEEASISWHENKNDYVPFIMNFLQILYRCFKNLDESFMEISLKKAKKNQRVENIIMNAIVPISKQDIIDKLPDISVKTIELVLGKMVKENKVTKIGTFKNARYIKNEE